MSGLAGRLRALERRRGDGGACEACGLAFEPTARPVVIPWPEEGGPAHDEGDEIPCAVCQRPRVIVIPWPEAVRDGR